MFDDIIKNKVTVLLLHCPACGDFMVLIPEWDVFECRNPACRCSVEAPESILEGKYCN